MPSSTGNGGVSASERILKAVATISISPVARFLFTAPARALTLPVTAITNSLLRWAAFSNTSVPAVASSNTI